MKITDIKIFTVDCFRTNWVFVKVYTDESIDGVGEATLEYKEKALWGAVELSWAKTPGISRTFGTVYTGTLTGVAVLC